MKKTALLLLMLFGVINVMAITNFTVSGTVDPKLNNEKMVIFPIYQPSLGLESKETECTILDGKFEFTVQADGLEAYLIKIISTKEKQNQTFRLLPKNTRIDFKSTDLSLYELTGNSFHGEIQGFNLKVYSLPKHEQHAFRIKWLQENLSSPLSSSILFGLIPRLTDVELKRFYQLIPKENLLGSIGSALQYHVENLSIGATAPLFSQNSSEQKVVSLSDYRGKYVLLDFWASWCVPCRAETPYLIKAHQNFKSKGFDILSVSLDDNASLWLQAIEKDQMVWANVSDLNGWENVVSRKLYKLGSIPASFLLDPTGKIIARNLRGNELEKKLKEVFETK